MSRRSKSISIAVLTIVGNARCAFAADAVSPTGAFDYPILRKSTTGFTEATRTLLVTALNSKDRDVRLQKLVGHRLVAGETWFDLRGMNFKAGDITHGTNLTRLCLDYARFNSSDLTGVDFYGLLLRSAGFNACRLDDTNLDYAYLGGADLRDCFGSGVNFSNSTFDRRTVFRSTRLKQVRFDNCDSMNGVTFDGCTILGGSFLNAGLRGAKLVNSTLREVRFRGADLSESDFFSSSFQKVDFTDADLQRCRLDTIRIDGPITLIRARVSETYFGDLKFDAVDVSYLRWPNGVYLLGEEVKADKLIRGSPSPTATNNEAITLYSQAESCYRRLAAKYRELGYSDEYLQLRYRAAETRRKLLSAQGTGSWELTWLRLQDRIDGYGTKPLLLLESFVSTIIVSTFLFLGSWLVGRKTAVWRTGHKDGSGYRSKPTGEFIESGDDPSEAIRKATGISGKVAATLSALGQAFLFSTQNTFMFVEQVINIPGLIDTLSKSDKRLVPHGFGARFVVAVQAALGLLFLYLAIRMAVLLVGS